MHDLLDESIQFTRKDIITLQNPKDYAPIRNINEFYHLKHGLAVSMSDDHGDRHGSGGINATQGMKKIFAQMSSSTSSSSSKGSRTTDEQQQQIGKQSYSKAQNSTNRQTVTATAAASLTTLTSASSTIVPEVKKSNVIISNQARASSLTSSAVHVVDRSFANREHEMAARNEKEFRSRKLQQYERVKKRMKKNKQLQTSHVTLHTSMGDITLELYSYLVPQTCDNFLGLCQKGYYDGTQFHRLIKGFMIQGGDPTGTGRGGNSLWGTDFKDEIHLSLKHDRPGILSMANRGKDTNGSQFFMTFKATPHLDNKHTVFGCVVDGESEGGSSMETLMRMQQVPTDARTSKPLTPITIESVTVHENPFADDELQQQRIEERKREENKETSTSYGKWFSDPTKSMAHAAAATTTTTAASTTSSPLATMSMKSTIGGSGSGGGVGRYIKREAFQNGPQFDFGALKRARETMQQPKSGEEASASTGTDGTNMQQQAVPPTKKPKTVNEFNFANW